MEGLTDQDRQVCSTISEESFSGYYELQVDYNFNDSKALPLLVGHLYRHLLFAG